MKLIDRPATSYYSELIKSIEETLGNSLLPGDERRIFSDALSYCFMGEDAVYNAAFMQFSPDTATGTFLDVLGARVGVFRGAGQVAQISLTCLKNDASDAFTIDAGTSFLVDGLPWVSVGPASTVLGDDYFTLILESEGKDEKNNGVSASSTILSSNADWAKVSGFFVRYIQTAQPADLEDEAFRQRVKAAYIQSPMANTAAAWLNEIQVSAPSVVDAEMKGNQGTLTVYPLELDSDGLNSIPSGSLCTNLQNTLNDSPRKPLGDVLVCTPPTAKNVSCSLLIDIPFAQLSNANSKKSAYLLEICRKLSGNCLADYSEAVLIDVVLDIVEEATDAHFVSDFTPGLNSANPKKALHLTGEVFVYSPANISMTFQGV